MGKIRQDQISAIRGWLLTGDKELAIRGVPYVRAAVECGKAVGFRVTASRLSRTVRRMTENRELSFYCGREARLPSTICLSSKQWKIAMDWVKENARTDMSAKLLARLMRRDGIKFASEHVVNESFLAFSHTSTVQGKK